MKERKYRAFFDNKMIYWNDRDCAFYISPSAGIPSIVFVHDFSNYPYFTGDGRLQGLMDSTGLTDKNKKEIYEGDILDHHTDRYIVQWNVPYACWENYNGEEGNLLGNIASMCEIVGNIFQNTDLIKQMKYEET